MEVSFNYGKEREARMEILRFLAALAIFICAVHLMCMREARNALARAEAPHALPVSATLNLPIAAPPSTLS
jgi:hypothetical protein